MAINRNPGPIRCADIWRHQLQPPPADVLVRGQGRVSFSGRCQSCLRSLAAASPQAILIDVYEFGPARTRTDPASNLADDDDPTPTDLDLNR